MQEQRSESSWKICWKQRNGEIMEAIIRAFPITDHLFAYFDQNNLLEYHNKYLRFLVNLEKLIKYKEEAQR